ncbi:site-specific DNA-methyltransferase [Lactobacillus iners]|uniref:DNA-methyltransferase n=1 Tax=Lactobacillus iners TaxID=147802 RepID=UPI0001E5DBA5|nr:DNA (cytosine-5-)-methyltransferase [Lactobacillus iners LactinV 03V1-b]MCT7739170.1 site-specific DNA-methyltransferase [Lactobacillus iners]
MNSINIFNQDCMQMLKDLPKNSIDLVVTDPPYIVKTEGGGAGAFGYQNRKWHQEIEFMTNGFSNNVLDELCQVMKKINIYIFCSQYQLTQLINYFENKKCNWNLISWHKDNPVPSCNNKYLSDTEYIFFAREKGVKLGGTYYTKRKYYVTHINTKEKHQYKHPTVKPVSIIDNLIINSSKEQDVILDPFMGSGSTGESALKLDRKFIGIEIKPEYYQIACSRLKKFDRQI